jgi:hypothetical protein
MNEQNWVFQLGNEKTIQVYLAKGQNRIYSLMVSL